MRIDFKKYYLISFLLLAIGCFLHLSFGSVAIDFTSELSNVHTLIIQEIRLPQVIASLLVGAGLSVSGLQMQTLFKNVLAGPSILGVSSGASLGVALLVLGGSIIALPDFGAWSTAIFAFLGALLVILVILSLTRKVKSNLAILIVGIMIGSATGSFVGFLQYVSNANNLQSFIIWAMGSTFIEDDQHLVVLASVIVFGVALSLILKNRLRLLLLDDADVKLLGISPKKNQRQIILISCLMVGAITAFCGPIAFIGLAVPHVVRFLTNSDDPSKILPLTILMGMTITVWCSWISVLPGMEMTLPLNIVTSFFGAPIVIWLVLKYRERHG